ncbi:MAG: hypothetical protein H6Q05_1678 [Acidobacteria bacterium]|nr:hypothetical protein [Acidobacteriota bacterium]
MRTGRVLVLVIGLLLLAAVVAMQLGNPPVLNAQRGCTNQMLRGSYGLHLQGWFYQSGPGSARVPAAQVGLVVFDGAGNMTLRVTTSIDGDVSSGGTGHYNYRVNPDCTGSLVPAVGTDGGPADFTLVDNAKQILIIGAGTESTLAVSGKQVWSIGTAAEEIAMVWSGVAIRQ